MTKKFNEIIEKFAKEVVAGLGEDELDYYLFCIDKNAFESKIRSEVIKALPQNGDLIKKIALWDSDDTNSIAAIERIDDEETLESIVYSNFNSMCQRAAIKKITNSKKLVRIIRKPDIPYIVKKAGIENINDQKEIENLASDKSVDLMIRSLAKEKMSRKEA